METTNDGLSGRGVLITGGGSGIGLATARAFAEEGADVLIVGRSAARLAEAARRHPEIRTLACDVSAPGAPEQIIDTALHRLGRLDVLVNNAAVTGSAPLGEIERDQAERLLAVNFLAPMYLAQAALPHLAAQGGTIVNVTSMPGSRGWPGNTVYGATKVALEFATHTWAMELAPHGIRVAAIAPGMIDTDIDAHNGHDPDQAAARRDAMMPRVPLGRRGRPHEVAWWILTLAHPGASYATGLVVPVDGGAFVT